jgi:hypothetical protein
MAADIPLKLLLLTFAGNVYRVLSEKTIALRRQQLRHLALRHIRAEIGPTHFSDTATLRT